jgi:hypothetical protein
MEAIKRPLLFETTEDGIIEDERVVWYPQFKKLSQADMTYVAWISDYNSPLYSQPIDRRKKLASDMLKTKLGEDIVAKADIDLAVMLYNEIQYDHLVEQLNSQRNILDVFTRELNIIHSMGDDKKDVERIIKATEMQQRAEKEIDRLQDKVLKRITQESKNRGNKVENHYYTWLQRVNNEVRS